MKTMPVPRITWVWLGLILATGLSWQFGHGFGFGEQFHYATIAILIITFIKVRFVFLDFMELRTAPLALRLAFEAWAVIVCGALIFLYWSGI
ncbi:MAG: hypothetical protein ACI9BW_003430 [Gammaproteobacteria bacterium]|jgi:hypothetical protein